MWVGEVGLERGDEGLFEDRKESTVEEKERKKKKTFVLINFSDKGTIYTLIGSGPNS